MYIARPLDSNETVDATKSNLHFHRNLVDEVAYMETHPKSPTLVMDSAHDTCP